MENNQVPTAGPHITSYFASEEFELLYVEQMVQSGGDRPNIYWSGCDFRFGPRGGYAGIQHQEDTVIDGVQFEYNNICSVWDLKEKELHLPPEVELVHGIEGVHSRHFGGEGTGLHTSHPMPWLPDQWYATVIRRYYIPDESKTRAAMFMYSYKERKWTMYISVAVPGANVPLTGNHCCGFLERFYGNELGYHGVYGQHFRMHKDGSWEKPLYYCASAVGNPRSWKPELYEGGNIKLIAGGIFDNYENYHTFHPDQVDEKPKPAKETPVILNVNTYYNKESNAISVNWEIAEDRPPQLKYRISIYRDSLFEGEPIATNSDYAPQKRSALLQPQTSLEPGTYWASVEFTDIFNQTSNRGCISFIVN